MKFMASVDDAWLRNDESIIGWMTLSVRLVSEPIFATISGACSGRTRMITFTDTRIWKPSRLMTVSGSNTCTRWPGAPTSLAASIGVCSAQSMVRLVVGMM